MASVQLLSQLRALPPVAADPFTMFPYGPLGPMAPVDPARPPLMAAQTTPPNYLTQAPVPPPRPPLMAAQSADLSSVPAPGSPFDKYAKPLAMFGGQLAQRGMEQEPPLQQRAPVRLGGSPAAIHNAATRFARARFGNFSPRYTPGGLLGS